MIAPHTHVRLVPPDGWFTETSAAAAGSTTVLDFQLFARDAAFPGESGAGRYLAR